MTTFDDVSLAEQVADLRRRLNQIVRPGVVTEVDLSNARARVRYSEAPDEATTDWLPWLTARAGADRTWWAPSVGEGVLILAPAGEMAAAAVLPALYQEAPRDAPGDEDEKHVTVYRTGAMVVHDAAAKTFTVTTAAGHAVVIEDDGDVVVPGDLHVAGDVLAAGDVRDGSAATPTMANMRSTYNTHTHLPPLGGAPAPTSRM